jgi:hypothetical protein
MRRRALKTAYHGDAITVKSYAADIEGSTLKLGMRFELVVEATLGPAADDDKWSPLLDMLSAWVDMLLRDYGPKQINLALGDRRARAGQPKATTDARSQVLAGGV